MLGVILVVFDAETTVGTDVAVDIGVTVGTEVAVDIGVAVGIGVAAGTVVAVGCDSVFVNSCEVGGVIPVS